MSTPSSGLVIQLYQSFEAFHSFDRIEYLAGIRGMTPEQLKSAILDGDAGDLESEESDRP